MKIALSILFTGIILIGKSQYVAVKLCNTNINSFKEYIKENGGETLAFTANNEYAIVKENNAIISFSIFCYINTVRVKDNMFCFETNTIILKSQQKLSAEIVANYGLQANKFIPNIYSIESNAKNAGELNSLLQNIKEQPWCAFVQANQIFTLKSTSNDTYYNRQWAIENMGTAVQGSGLQGADMQVDSAWTITQGNPNIKIAILDSGVDTLHEDLTTNMLDGYDGFATDTTDTKGYPTPNFSNDGHGTACAGIAAAVADNNTGIAGIANQCKIIPVRIFYYRDYGGGIGVQATTSTNALLNGSAYAWRYANADVMSVSAGLLPLHIAFLSINTQLVTDEIEAAFYQGRNGFGVPMFFSSGNEDNNDVLWPAELPTTIAIGASSMCDERKNPNDCSTENWGASYGHTLDVVAPGVLIASTDMTSSNGYSLGNYTFNFNGTSAACPNAAGVGALILSVNDSLHARDVKALINITANRVGAYSYDSTTAHGTWNIEMGHGRINAFEAVKQAQTYQTTVNINAVNENTVAIKIFPNPSSGNVSFKNLGSKNITVEIYNLLGKHIETLAIDKNDIVHYYFAQNGYYFIKNKMDNSTYKLLIKL